MLDQLRKHASSWAVKTVLSLIILTFILFFGYSRVASRYRHSEVNVAQVGDTAIPRRKFETMYQSSMDRMRENMKGEMPQGLSDFLRQNVLDQMITRETIVQYAHDLGLTVSDDELANTIRANKNLFPDGNFDLDVYEKRFLPSYQQRYGENYETTVRRDLLVEKTQVLMTTLFGPWQSELDSSLEDIQKTLPKPVSPASKDTKKNAKNETHPSEAESQPNLVESMSPFDLFSTWLNGFKDKVKIQVFERES